MMQELVFVDDRPCSELRPCSFNYELFSRDDVQPILLRVLDEPLGDDYLKKTECFPQFYVDLNEDIAKETLRFSRWCQQNGLAPYHFCCMSEPRQEFWQRFARTLGLPSISEKAIQALRQKPIMKEWIRASGLNTAEYALADKPEDVYDFVKKVGYPVILKPVDGWGTIYTKLLRKSSDVDDAFCESFPHRMMVEEFIEHKEYECCALIQNKQVLDIYPSIMPMSPLEAANGQLNANISVPATREAVPAGNELKEIVQNLVNYFGLDSGYMHMEFFVSPDGKEVLVSELALRYPGCEIAKNHGLARNFNMAGATLDVYLGRKPNLQTEVKRCVGDLLLPYKSGLVENVMSSDELEALPGVLEAHIGVSEGQVLPRVGSASFNCSGWVFVEGKSSQEVESRMQKVLDQYKLQVRVMD